MVLLQRPVHQNLKSISTIGKAAAVLKVTGPSGTVASMEASSRPLPSSKSLFCSTSLASMNSLKRSRRRAMRVPLVEWRIFETENQERWVLRRTTIGVEAWVALQVGMATTLMMTKMKWGRISGEISMKRTQVSQCPIYTSIRRTQGWIVFLSDRKQVMGEGGKTTITV